MQFPMHRSRCNCPAVPIRRPASSAGSRTRCAPIGGGTVLARTGSSRAPPRPMGRACFLPWQGVHPALCLPPSNPHRVCVVRFTGPGARRAVMPLSSVWRSLPIGFFHPPVLQFHRRYSSRRFRMRHPGLVPVSPAPASHRKRGGCLIGGKRCSEHLALALRGFRHRRIGINTDRICPQTRRPIDPAPNPPSLARKAKGFRWTI